MANSCGLMGDGEKPVKIHHLVKAPENTPESVASRESWDASKPVTVYKTPENLPDGTPCTAATVILRTKGCVWCGNLDVPFADTSMTSGTMLLPRTCSPSGKRPREPQTTSETARWSRYTHQEPSSRIERILQSGRSMF